MGSDEIHCYTYKSLGELVEVGSGKLNSCDATQDGKFPFFTCGQEVLKINKFEHDKEAVLLGGNNRTATFSLFYYNGKFTARQRVYVISSKNKTILDNRFLYLALQYRMPTLSPAARGTTTQFITLPMLKGLSIPIPEISTQRQIASFIWALNNKIALLRETNTTLEAIAQAIFKSWFVDFAPVCAKAEGRDPEGIPPEVADLFPSEFEESELGATPKGWSRVPFGDLLSHALGGDWGKDESDDQHTVLTAIVRGTDMPAIKTGIIDGIPRRFVSPKKLQSRLLKDGDIAIEVSGGSKSQPTGRSIYITDELLSGFDTPVAPTSFCRLFRAESPEMAMILAMHLSSIYLAGKMWNYQVQSTGLANFQTTHFLQAEHVVVPCRKVQEAFFRTVRPLIQRQHTSEIRVLAELRDTLLPRLMSGKLRLKEIERDLSEHL